MTFNEIFDAILMPRENGSAALDQVGTWLERAARATGADVVVHQFTCRPYLHSIAGIVALVAGLGLAAAIWRRRFGWALLLGLFLPAYLLLELQFHTPLLSAVHSVPEQNIVLSLPASEATQTVILGAHYDTETDLLPRSWRAPLQFLLAPMLILTVATAFSGWRRHRHGATLETVDFFAAVLALYYAGLFLSLAGGMFVSQPSPGALDDGAAVGVLLKAAEALGDGTVDLAHTDVKIALFSGEEVGLQGSWQYVRDTRPQAEPHPTYYVNAEIFGAGIDMRYFTSDRSWLRRDDASGVLMRTLDRAYRRVTGRGIFPDPQPITSDAQSFMAAGIPSICLASSRGGAVAVPGLYSASDTRDRLDGRALDLEVEFVLAALRQIDSEAPPAATSSAPAAGRNT